MNVDLKNYLFILAIMLAQSVMTLPKYSKPSKINELQSYAISRDPVLMGTQIFSDDIANMIYVSPSSKKATSGIFQPVAMPACDILKDQYELTYLMPKVSTRNYVDFAKNGPYSPFFDAKLGNYVRHASIMNRIMQKVEEISEIKNNNKALVIAYEEVKIKLEQAQAEYSAAEASYEQLNRNILSLLELLKVTTDAEEKAHIEKSLIEARKYKETEELARKERLRLALKELLPLKPQYAQIKANYDATVPNIENLNSDIASLEAIYESIHRLSVNHLNTNERALQAFESTTVGMASASYSIWADEEARLREVLATYGRRNDFSKHSVSRLPIHNIRLKKPVGNVALSHISGSFNGNTSMKVISAGASPDGLSIADHSKLSTNPIFIKNQQFVLPQIETLSGDGAGTYTNLVTRGAYCTGSSQRNSWRVKAEFTDEKVKFETQFDVYGYRPRTANVLAQSVALDYEFFVRSDPIKANCTMQISKFRDFVVNSGSSGILFWKTAWSETDRKRMDQSGIVCNITMSPSGQSPDYKEQEKRIELIRQAMIQEIAAEFILTYAKSWEVTQRQPALPKNNNAAFTAGVALEALCGLNPYCAVGSIILKTGDELFGSQADKVKNRDYLSGSIRRSYDETSWTLSNGTAVIDLLVRI